MLSLRLHGLLAIIACAQMARLIKEKIKTVQTVHSKDVQPVINPSSALLALVRVDKIHQDYCLIVHAHHRDTLIAFLILMSVRAVYKSV